MGLWRIARHVWLGGPCLTIALVAWIAVVGAQPADDVPALEAKISELRLAGKFSEAHRLGELYAAESKARFGEASLEHATALDGVAATYFAQSRFEEAEPIYQKVLGIREKILGPNHEDVLSTLTMLANLYRATRRPNLADPIMRRVLAAEEQATNPDQQSIANALKGLAEVQMALQRYGEAQQYIRRALALVENSGENSTQVSQLLVVLAQVERRQGNLALAASTLERALSLHEKINSEQGNADLLAQAAHINTLTQMAALSQEMNLFDIADEIIERVATLSEKMLGPDHPIVASALEAVANSYERHGRLAQAEPRRKRAIDINERAYGREHINVALSVHGLGNLYAQQYRFDEAIGLLQRALGAAEATLGPENPALVDHLASLGELYLLVENWSAAELLMTRALANLDKAQDLGPTKLAVQTIRILRGLAYLYGLQGRRQDARPFLERALAISERVLGPHHDSTGDSLTALAVHLLVEDRLDEAERLFDRAVSISKRSGGESRAYANNIAGLGMVFFKREDWSKAHAHMKTASTIYIALEQRGLAGVAVGTQQEASRPVPYDEFFLSQALAAYRMAAIDNAHSEILGDEAFQLVQRTQSSRAAAALSQMAARFASGTGPLADLMRERQDLAGEWRALDKALTVALAAPSVQRDAPIEEALRARLVETGSRLDSLDLRLAKEFPQYASLTNPQPLSVAATQSVLAPQEVLIFVASLAAQSLVWVIGNDDARVFLVPTGRETLSREVAALRCGLDHSLWRGDAREEQCVEMLNNKHRYQLSIDGQVVDVLPFNLERAHGLYRALFAPVEAFIKDKHLLIVPTGPLASLPFNVLITEPPNVGTPHDPAQYRDAAWLAARQPVTVLPSVGSLKALRQFAKSSQASKPYLGVGNPLLDGPQDDQIFGEHFKNQAQAARDKHCLEQPVALRMANIRGARSIASFRDLMRGSTADIEEIRAQVPLPETADELCQIGRRLGVPDSEILLGSRATERFIKDLSQSGRLAEYAIIHFATHGALTGQVLGATEPGLILTPPAPGTNDPKMLERDDGFLTASEIATLKLNADWVVLSACNTAGSGHQSAEALSGMAQAFFYAGARALLVSHWEVGSAAAVQLTTRSLAEMNANPRTGRSEAFRIAMRELMAKGSSFDAHPSQWAPFVVIGEGAVPQVAK